ncbi:OsmC family peroxiredoxin [Flavobacterium capsici]|uniref:OsmC family peroxiredoxin n=1 Tax=Flavobacterium capsici TaxID=3075618 RepID=A0AA96EXQ1_9FLAO|nr:MULTISPECIES: OsmC family peroxiredoxin [unclassified Flavobacterium]WNM20409.1 OsmC family peroxiredoxin [Flavobacterium sp. PMR2A8]WNM23174.1 OsmC family peroxiredoxin [Flavobacterium sp. PMTSA4]
MKRNATAVWNGTGKDGKGNLTTQSGVLSTTQYSFSSRFEDGIGTNPEELIAAAHAGCFTMKLAFNLQAEGFAADELQTKGEVILADGTVTESNLTLKATVSGISEAKFEELVRDAEANCPISKLLTAKITVNYTLN